MRRYFALVFLLVFLLSVLLVFLFFIIGNTIFNKCKFAINFL